MAADNSQFLDLLSAILFPLKAGCLWWARDDLLSESTARTTYPYYESDRTGHALVFISDITRDDFFHPIPALIGFSKTFPRAFTAKGLSEERGFEYTTEFSMAYHPTIPFSELYTKDSNADRNQLTGYWHHRSRIKRNEFKPNLESKEIRSMETWKNTFKKLS